MHQETDDGNGQDGLLNMPFGASGEQASVIKINAFGHNSVLLLI